MEVVEVNGISSVQNFDFVIAATFEYKVFGVAVKVQHGITIFGNFNI